MVGLMGKESPVITVIIPMHQPSHILPRIQTVLATACVPIQTLIVLNNPTSDLQVSTQAPNEEVLFSSREGRGYAFLTGIAHAKGEVILLLHADTVPPVNWDRAILKALKNPQVVGGGFSLTYDQPKGYLTYGAHFIDLVFRVTGELYGDRGMFVRTQTLQKCLNAMDVPLFEDVKLSKCMRSQGKIVMLKDKIIASTEEFLKHGMLGNIKRYVTCRLWYAFGATPQQLYQAYYKKQ